MAARNLTCDVGNVNLLGQRCVDGELEPLAQA